MSQGQKKSKRVQTLVAKLYFIMPLIYDCQAKRDIAEQVFDIGKTLLM